jgi:hypothetical protein
MLKIGDKVKYDGRQFVEDQYFTGTIEAIYGEQQIVIIMDKQYHFYSENKSYFITKLVVHADFVSHLSL